MELKCDFEVWTWDSSHRLYTCIVTSAAITKIDDGTIKSFTGNHLNGKSNKDVEAVWFHFTELSFFPRGLQTIFPQLNAVQISYCGLKEITRDDLVGLENLEAIYLNSNLLTFLPSNLFENMTKLRRISFVGNKVEFVSSDLLKPIMNNRLDWVDFRKNKNINAFYKPGKERSVATIEALMEIIETNCKSPPAEEIKYDQEIKKDEEAHNLLLSKSLIDWMTSSHFSDFTISVDSKKFPVHKWIFSAQSSVLAEIFSSKEDNKGIDINLTEFGVEPVADFIRYFYAGKFPKPDNAINVFKISAKLDAAKLKTISEQIICRNVLKTSNAYEIFMLGHDHASNKLKSAGFQKLKSAFPDNNLSEKLMENPVDLKHFIDLLNKYN